MPAGLFELADAVLPQTREERWVAALAKENRVGTSGLQRLCVAIDIVPLAFRKLFIEAIGCSRFLQAEQTGNAT